MQQWKISQSTPSPLKWQVIRGVVSALQGNEDLLISSNVSFQRRLSASICSCFLLLLHFSLSEVVTITIRRVGSCLTTRV